MDIPEDYSHAELWGKYKHYQRKIEKIRDWVVNWEGDCPDHLLTIIDGSKQTITGEKIEDRER